MKEKTKKKSENSYRLASYNPNMSRTVISIRLINNLASGGNLPNTTKGFSRNRIAEFNVIKNSFRGRVAHFSFSFCQECDGINSLPVGILTPTGNRK